MSKENGKGRSAAPWILVYITVDLKGEREPMAQVRTPDGDKEVPLSEAKGKVNILSSYPSTRRKDSQENCLVRLQPHIQDPLAHRVLAKFSKRI